MTLFERLREGSSTPTATAIPANPAAKKRNVAESSSFSSSSAPANDAENVDGYCYDPEEAARFWHGMTARIDEIDTLINQLCDLRNDSDEHRADLLAVRKRMAPRLIDGDIAYLRSEIEQALLKHGKNKT